MTTPAPDQQRHDQAEAPTLRDCLEVLRRHFGPVEVLEVRQHEPTVAAARRRQQTTRSWRLLK